MFNNMFDMVRRRFFGVNQVFDTQKKSNPYDNNSSPDNDIIGAALRTRAMRYSFQHFGLILLTHVTCQSCDGRKKVDKKQYKKQQISFHD